MCPVDRYHAVQNQLFCASIAEYCIHFGNYNSALAILSGVTYSAVTRLRSTLERLPASYLRLIDELQRFANPARNMQRYRALVADRLARGLPMIPIVPIVKKVCTLLYSTVSRGTDQCPQSMPFRCTFVFSSYPPTGSQLQHAFVCGGGVYASFHIRVRTTCLKTRNSGSFYEASEFRKFVWDQKIELRSNVREHVISEEGRIWTRYLLQHCDPSLLPINPLLGTCSVLVLPYFMFTKIFIFWEITIVSINEKK